MSKSDGDEQRLLAPGAAEWRRKLAKVIEGKLMQRIVVGAILVNAVVLGMETDKGLVNSIGHILHTVDTLCLIIFVIEILMKLAAYQWRFWRSGWNVFDFLVVAIALAPGAGPLAVLRALRVFRVLRLLTVLPQLLSLIHIS